MSVTAPIRRIEWPVTDDGAGGHGETDPVASREWLVTNGLGGYASGTVSGVVTRRYHGLLVAALPSPLGRVVMLSHLAEQLRVPAQDDIDLAACLREFRLEQGLPAWRFEAGEVTVEKRLFLRHRQNTVQISYGLIAGAPRVELALRPSVNFRAQEAPVSEPLQWPYELHSIEDRIEISIPGSMLPRLRLVLHAGEASFTLKGKRVENLLYPVEESRGYQATGALWSPGYFVVSLAQGEWATLIASAESPEMMAAVAPDAARELEATRRHRLLAQAEPIEPEGIAGELVLAADQFIVTPAARAEEAVQAQAAGDEVRTIIAGYHWFTDWGRDTMISLEGLTLLTGRQSEAGYILRTFASHVRDGLIPNLFPEGEREGLYHTADATLWFFHAIDRYMASTGDHPTFDGLYPILKDIVGCHLAGTHFGIRVDPNDGLLTQGAPGYQLTWMDAKVDGWVVTPRRGKAVEINALWYNALKLMEGWAAQQHDPACSEYGRLAERARRSFNARFWYEAGGYLYDVVDGEHPAGSDKSGAWNDPKCRPNQIFAISLPHAVLDRSRWEAVIRVVYERLVTPVGLRSLAPDDPEYKSKYFGDLRARDAAYHQGTVWGWLAGPFVDAWLRVFPDELSGARRALEGFPEHLNRACVGSISEVFDAEEPYTPRGCIAQAWSVAEVLRALIKLDGASSPRAPSSS